MNNHRKFSKAVEAVSPVVATLLLVLVAAGAAIGFGVFLNGFQKKTQSNVSSDAPSETIHIGGSSTVFEMTKKIIPAWNAAHPTIAIDSQEGGSGVGKQAICQGLVDIGASSSAVAASGSAGQDLATCPDLNRDGVKDAGKDLVQTVIAYDAVVMATSSATMAADCPANTVINLTPANIKELYEVNGAHQAANAAANPELSAPTATINGNPAYAWKDLNTGSVATPAHACTGTSAVTLGERSDQGGTEDGFCSKFLSVAVGNVFCTSDTHQLLSGPTARYSQTVGSPGNDGIRTWLNANLHTMSFIGWGSVTESGSGLTTGKMSDVAPTSSNVKAAGLSACGASATTSAQFCAARPLEYITVGQPTGAVLEFINFVLTTQNNLDFAKAAGYVSVYA